VADFPGGSYQAPNLSQSSPDGVPGQTDSPPNLSQGSLGGAGAAVSYSLTAVCVADGLRHYWTDASVSLANAPACAGGYVPGTLVVLGSW